MRVCVYVIAEYVGVLWHKQPYSNPLPLSQPMPPPQCQVSALAPGKHRMASLLPFSELLVDIISSRGQEAPQYHVLSHRHCGIACFVTTFTKP